MLYTYVFFYENCVLNTCMFFLSVDVFFPYFVAIKNSFYHIFLFCFLYYLYGFVVVNFVDML